MTVYLDTSVVLRCLLHEPQPITCWGKWQAAYSSRVWLTEAQRTVDRLRLEGRIGDADVARLHTELLVVHDTLHIVPVSGDVLARAGEAFATTLGPLDAIAVRASMRVDRLLTHDRQLAVAAMSTGFAVDGV